MTFLTPVRLILLFSVATFLGIILIPFVKIDLLPQYGSKGYTIRFQTAKSSPKLNETLYTSTFENAFSQLTQLRNVNSTTEESGGEIVLEFDEQANLEAKRFEILMLIRRLYPRLPKGISYPVVEASSDLNKREAQAIRVYMVDAVDQSSSITTVTQQYVMRDFYNVAGIKSVELSGTQQMELTIDYDPYKSQVYQISPAALIAQLQQQFSNTYPGSLQDLRGRQLFIQLNHPDINVQQLQQMQVSTGKGFTVALKDLATLKVVEQKSRSYLRVNGRNGINVSLYPKPGTNAVQLSDQLDRMAAAISSKLPPGYSLQLVYDKTDYLKRELQKNYRRTALSVLILLSFILIAYRSITASVVLITSLIANLGLSILLVIIFRVNVNLYAIGGITIAFGLMVDNAIVMLDHYRKRQNRQIITALTGATLNVVMALCLVYLLPLRERVVYQDFAAIIILALLSSILVALGFTPAVATLLNENDSTKQRHYKSKRTTWLRYHYYRQGIRYLSGHRKMFITVIVLLFGVPLFLLPAEWKGDTWYQRLYNNIIGSDLYRYRIRPHTDVWLGGGLRPFVKSMGENGGRRSPDQVKLYITGSMRDGNTADQMNALFITIDRYLGQQAGVAQFITYIESGQYGGIEIFIKGEYGQGNYPLQLKGSLMRLCENMQGVRWSVFGVGLDYSSGSFETKASYSILLRGYNVDQLQTQALKLQQMLQQNQRVSNINLNEHYDYRDRTYQVHQFTASAVQLRHMGLNPAQLQKLLQDYTQQDYPLTYATINGVYTPVYLRAVGYTGRSAHDFLHNSQFTDSGKVYTLQNVGALSSYIGSQTLYKKNRQYLQVVSYDYSGDEDFAIAHQRKLLKELGSTLPVGYTASKHGFNFEEGKEQIHWLLLPILLYLTLLITAILFENLRQPFLILLLIPLSFIGLFYIFGCADFPIDQGSYAAFIMLGALVANASIFLVNDYNQLLRYRKTSTNTALFKAFFARSRPIILTMLSCCCGLLPFLVDGPTEVFWYCFAVGTLAGLLFSFFTLFICLPVFMLREPHKPSPL